MYRKIGEVVVEHQNGCSVRVCLVAEYDLTGNLAVVSDLTPVRAAPGCSRSSGGISWFGESKCSPEHFIVGQIDKQFERLRLTSKW